MTSKKYAKIFNFLCASNKDFVKYQAQGGVLTQKPLAYALDFRYRGWFEAFLDLRIGDGGGTSLELYSYTLQMPLGCPFESKVLAHYSCCCGPL